MLPRRRPANSQGDGSIHRLALLLVVLTLAVPAGRSIASQPRHGCAGAAQAIVFYRNATWRWQTQRDTARSPAGHAERSRSCAFKRWAARRWRDHARHQRGLYLRWFDATYEKWECIHQHEGGWDASSAKYGGGLQMDDDFQATYGREFGARWGWASGWPVWAQLVAAERAFHGYGRHRGRGFSPWPNTSRACGLG